MSSLAIICSSSLAVTDLMLRVFSFTCWSFGLGCLVRRDAPCSRDSKTGVAAVDESLFRRASDEFLLAKPLAT